MKAEYDITLKDIKKGCFEAVKTLDFLKKQRLYLSISFPFFSLLLPILTHMEWNLVYIWIPFFFFYVYFYGYADRLYTIIRRVSYKHSPERIRVGLELKEAYMIVQQDSISRRVKYESIVDYSETESDLFLFLSKKEASFIVIKKKPDSLSDKEWQLFKERLRAVLSKHFAA